MDSLHAGRAARFDPETLYEEGELRLVLGVTERALRQARVCRGLRSIKIGRARLYLGKSILAWLERAEREGVARKPGGAR